MTGIIFPPTKCFQTNYHYQLLVHALCCVNLHTRNREHVRVTKAQYKINNNSSSVYSHSSTNGRHVSFENFAIISSTSNSIELLAHENPLNLTDLSTLNSQMSSIQVTLFEILPLHLSISFMIFTTTPLLWFAYLMFIYPLICFPKLSQRYPCRVFLISYMQVLSPYFFYTAD